jgi:hypothetical protein
LASSTATTAKVTRRWIPHVRADRATLSTTKHRAFQPALVTPVVAALDETNARAVVATNVEAFTHADVAAVLPTVSAAHQSSVPLAHGTALVTPVVAALDETNARAVVAT